MPVQSQMLLVLRLNSPQALAEEPVGRVGCLSKVLNLQIASRCRSTELMTAPSVTMALLQLAQVHGGLVFRSSCRTKTAVFVSDLS